MSHLGERHAGPRSARRGNFQHHKPRPVCACLNVRFGRCAHLSVGAFRESETASLAIEQSGNLQCEVEVCWDFESHVLKCLQMGKKPLSLCAVASDVPQPGPE